MFSSGEKSISEYIFFRAIINIFPDEDKNIV